MDTAVHTCQYLNLIVNHFNIDMLDFIAKMIFEQFHWPTRKLAALVSQKNRRKLNFGIDPGSKTRLGYNINNLFKEFLSIITIYFLKTIFMLLFIYMFILF